MINVTLVLNIFYYFRKRNTTKTFTKYKWISRTVTYLKNT